MILFTLDNSLHLNFSLPSIKLGKFKGNLVHPTLL